MYRKHPARRLTRAVNPMPATIRKQLVGRGLLGAYRERPAYQRNDYLGWIARAQRDATRAKRIEQMLDELARGDRYMRMKYRVR